MATQPKNINELLDIYGSVNGQELPIQIVDLLADTLVEAYDNPDFRRWYCGVIYEFGVKRILDWNERSLQGMRPEKLFSSYVKSARALKKLGKASGGKIK